MFDAIDEAQSKRAGGASTTPCVDVAELRASLRFDRERVGAPGSPVRVHAEYLLGVLDEVEALRAEVEALRRWVALDPVALKESRRSALGEAIAAAEREAEVNRRRGGYADPQRIVAALRALPGAPKP
jgi:hypothetical protein